MGKRFGISRPLFLNNVISPYGLSILSTLLFLVAWGFPPKLYAELMNEPDLMFGDVQALLFFALCVIGFWAGLLLMDFLLDTPSLTNSKRDHERITGFAAVAPVLFTTTMTVLTAIKIAQDTPDFVTLLITQQAEVMKAHYLGMNLGILGWGSNMHTPVLWWTYWCLCESELPCTKRARRLRYLTWCAFSVGILAQLAMAIVKVSRGDLLPLFVGLVILRLITSISRGMTTPSKVLRYLALVPALGLCLFISFAILRGSSSADILLSSLLGYTAASYNRLAAVLQGTMRYPFAGRGAYLFVFLNANNLLNTVFPAREIFHWPDAQTLWLSEFQAPVSAGLRYDLIWSGTFGSLFSELGWWTPFFLVGYGMLYSFFWRAAKLGSVLGIILYPWLAFGILFWFSLNGIFDNTFPFMVVTAIVLTLYRKLIMMRFIRLQRTWKPHA